MGFRIATCEFPDRADAAKAAWHCLQDALFAEPVDLLVLPELAGVGSFWASPTFDDIAWREAVTAHAGIADELRRLGARRILGTRAVEADGRRWNETFLWKPEMGLRRGRPKGWLPEQEGGWEATWFDRGPQRVDSIQDDELCYAELVCTEIMVSGAARRLGQAGVQVIAAPRATGGHSRWEVATRMAAIAAGAFVVTANRRGGDLAGGSWIVAPDGDILARTSENSPIIFLDIDLSVADGAKQTYPRNVRD
ncbi:carbon-nitrogen hydrolase family protein [Bradyrhizobium arachidis]|uniref:Carbon-nitrogen hydrolase family protein n=1 Tax=Bradyrhizobium arachidis TaxID=858423 RepID=A0AAE7NL58_9BRAD|nr:carbon-nitrogen hydrolase family protein [Bradyrhizobium arachidis]QOZ67296.1 carbon-nitrogen hydrolase family protein [Bradyrhizobium arachidis]SFU79534.1 N-carbamoylputrescine amidase [Bradyrhizobium arachidis]